jgi:hypothetical protein
MKIIERNQYLKSKHAISIRRESNPPISILNSKIPSRTTLIAVDYWKPST